MYFRYIHTLLFIKYLRKHVIKILYNEEFRRTFSHFRNYNNHITKLKNKIKWFFNEFKINIEKIIRKYVNNEIIVKFVVYILKSE